MCLLEAESILESGKWKDAKGPVRQWFCMLQAENAYLMDALFRMNPGTVLEVGTGTGRIAELIAKNSGAIVTTTEKDAEMRAFAMNRFEGEERVKVIGTDGVPDGERFDLAVCMMNTIGNNSDERVVLKGMLSAADTVIFSVYRKGSEAARTRVYRARGHEKLSVRGSCVHFSDEWCAGLVSKSYTRKGITRMLRGLSCSAKIANAGKMGYIVEAGMVTE